MKKIRVGFILDINESWLGGVNYFKNLLSIINEYKDYEIEPVVFIAKDIDRSLLTGYPEVEIIESGLFQRWHCQWFVRKVIIKIAQRDICLERLLKKYNIDVISHVQANLNVKTVPMIAWIPDFQHKYLPELFSQEEIMARDFCFKSLAENCWTVILSSYDAKKDFEKFFPECKSKAHVLQFVVPVELVKVDSCALLAQYKLENKFFFLPNQFWQHKNHRVVLEAIKILKKKNIEIQVVCSGNTGDYRNKQHYDSLMADMRQNHLDDNFLVLGKIPYNDVQALSQECIALINPSLFEGWSTIVEEAKSMGKRIVLSDLAVHKEQNPSKGILFERNNPQELAQILNELWNEFDMRHESGTVNCDKIDFSKRKKDQAKTFREIIDFCLRKA